MSNPAGGWLPLGPCYYLVNERSITDAPSPSPLRRWNEPRGRPHMTSVCTGRSPLAKSIRVSMHQIQREGGQELQNFCSCPMWKASERGEERILIPRVMLWVPFKGRRKSSIISTFCLSAVCIYHKVRTSLLLKAKEESRMASR